MSNFCDFTIVRHIIETSSRVLAVAKIESQILEAVLKKKRLLKNQMKNLLKQLLLQILIPSVMTLSKTSFEIDKIAYTI
ncbi:hypothetical protein BpHYR1_035873 [Brachionus plicatilis]|uniref:Uncharacterized protein n=1 Tax=Brachionus plicatilis TaxID=10195 RepID=A0A3M7SK62_BRAPC|nr:hypothetical protein BpHYR1_035873 [Brachionus plicatilis]